jgi:hypothetical protein
MVPWVSLEIAVRNKVPSGNIFPGVLFLRTLYCSQIKNNEIKQMKNFQKRSFPNGRKRKTLTLT